MGVVEALPRRVRKELPALAVELETEAKGAAVFLQRWWSSRCLSGCGEPQALSEDLEALQANNAECSYVGEGSDLQTQYECE